MESEQARKLLTREKERAESIIAGLRQAIAANAGDEDEADIGAGAARLHDEEVDLGLIEDLEDRLKAIDRASQRLEDGGFGLSVESGEPIPDARLELIPWAERTTEEEARLANTG